MKTIWLVLRDGDAKERLSVVADLVSIIGVSIASVVATMFATEATLDWGQIIGFTIVGLLALAGSLVVLVVFLVMSFYIGVLLEDHRTVRALLLSAVWIAFTALFLWAAFFTYDVVAHTRFTR